MSKEEVASAHGKPTADQTKAAITKLGTESVTGGLKFSLMLASHGGTMSAVDAQATYVAAATAALAALKPPA